MLRRLLIPLTLLVGFCVVSNANADVFYSGRVDISSSQPNVRLITGYTGVSYTNKVDGDNTSGRVRAVGVVNGLGSTLQNFTSVPFGNNIVAVFALEGKFVGNLATGNLDADFDPVSGGGIGQVRWYDLGTNTIDITDPSSWVNNINSLAVGTIAVFDLVTRPTDILTGPPGPPATTFVNFLNENLINTAGAVQGTTGPEGDARIKLELNSAFALDPTGISTLDPLFVYQPGQIVNPLTPTLIIDLDEIGEGSGAGSVVNTTQLGTIFDAFTGLTGGFLGGGTYTPNDPFGSGDTAQSISGGDIYPGSQVPPGNEVPEPASIIVWSLLAIGGAGYRAMRQRKTA
jgi:hypothetical protein